VLLSTTTSTGFQLANEGRDARTEVVYHPVDFLPVVLRVVGMVRPAALVLVEAEIWPNLTMAAKRGGAPVVLINARISPRSHRRYRKARFVVASLFRQIDAVGVQTEEDLGRLVAIGFLPDQLHVTGSIKFDPVGTRLPDASACARILRSCGFAGEAPVLLGASTHPGEEKLLLEVYRKLRGRFPELRLVLVPRHAERCGNLLPQLQESGGKIILRSTVRAENEKSEPVDSETILLVDTTGELRQWTQLADVVVIGKSFLARGGQNPAEAILAGKPLIFGPHMENFKDLVRLLVEAQAARQVVDAKELVSVLVEMLGHPAEAAAMAVRATGVLRWHEGATARTVALLRSLPRTPP